MKYGKFITFEGGDGCGKSTQIKQTAHWLQAQGIDVRLTFEPGDTALGQKVRQLLLSGEHVPAAATELLLFLADRAQHVAEVIQPALQAGTWVLCDRYSDSTLAYQLAGRKLENTAALRNMLVWAEQGVSPDLTLWFDLSVEGAAARMRLRQQEGEQGNRLDHEKQAFHQAVYQAFQSIHQAHPNRIHAIDAAPDMVQVQSDVQKRLAPLLVMAS